MQQMFNGNGVDFNQVLSAQCTVTRNNNGGINGTPRDYANGIWIDKWLTRYLDSFSFLLVLFIYIFCFISEIECQVYLSNLII